MKTVRIIGVPEHFNFPWQMAIAEGAFSERGIRLEWTDIAEGTGRMCELLGAGTVDLAVILTEGIVKYITEGNPVRIVQEYISSPLLWGIHVAAGSDFQSVQELQNKKAAISRPSSGSQLMAYLHAEHMGWDPDSLEFVTVHHSEGAINVLQRGTAHYFLWEHFTTKPLVDRQVFRRLSDFPSPWPCFVIAARQDFLENEADLLDHILEVINLYSGEFRQIPSIDRTLANRYGQQVEDIREWLGKTRWSQKQINSNIIDNVLVSLHNLKLIEKIVPAKELLYKSS